MKKRIITLVLAVFLLIATPVYATGHKEKITICHTPSLTGDHCDRYVYNKEARNEHFYPDGTPRPGHENDRLLMGDVDCHSEQQSHDAKEEHKPAEKTPVVAPTIPVTPSTAPTAPVATPQEVQQEQDYETVMK